MCDGCDACRLWRAGEVLGVAALLWSLCCFGHFAAQRVLCLRGILERDTLCLNGVPCVLIRTDCLLLLVG